MVTSVSALTPRRRFALRSPSIAGERVVVGDGSLVVGRDHGAEGPHAAPLPAVAARHGRDGAVVVLRDDVNVAAEVALVVVRRHGGGGGGGGARREAAGFPAAREDREPKVRRVERHISEIGAVSEHSSESARYVRCG